MSAVTTRFDQRSGEPYGRCMDCDLLEFATQDIAHEHMHSRRGHRIRVVNQSRPERIESEVGQLVQDAIDEAINRISDLTYGRRGGLPDATEAEITEAISRCYDGFAEAWGEYLDENGDDEAEL